MGLLAEGRARGLGSLVLTGRGSVSPLSSRAAGGAGEGEGGTTEEKASGGSARCLCDGTFLPH